MNTQRQPLSQWKIASLEEINLSIENFMNSNDQLLVLSSMDMTLRDSWLLKFINYKTDYPVVKWAHSTRITKLIENRVGIELQSVYQTIYGKPAKIQKTETEEYEDETEVSQELAEEELMDGLDLIPIRSDEDLSSNAVIIIHEAHLIGSTKVQNDIINFGTGCLLNDLLFHLELEKNKRKLILIGDPYLLSFGKHSETALNSQHLSSLFKGKILALAHKNEINNFSNPQSQKALLANCIDQNLFNNLQYTKNDSLEVISREDVKLKMTKWFSNKTLVSNAVLVYTNIEASQINKWIKTNVLKNGEFINTDDLLLTQNNVYIQNDSDNGFTKNIYNGTFLKVIEVIGFLEPLIIGKNNVKLEYLKLRVKILNGKDSDVMFVNVLLNYFNQVELTKEQHIALRILASTRYYSLMKKLPFEESIYFKNVLLTNAYNDAKTEHERLNNAKKSGEKITNKSIKEQERIYKRLINIAKKKYSENLKLLVLREDEFVNALYVRHGWAMTVNKSIGFQFDEVIFKADSEFITGYNNRNYFTWIYSGLSAASKVYLSNPKTISPIDGCKFEDDTTLEQNKSDSVEKKIKLVFNDYILPLSIQEKSNEDYNLNTLACINELTSSLIKFGALLLNIEKKDTYLYKASFSLQDAIGNNIIVTLNNNGKGEVSSIRIDKCPNNFKIQVQQAIDSLFEMTLDSVTEEKVDGFRLHLFNKWKLKASIYNLSIKVLNCHTYHDFLQIENHIHQSKFKLTYNGSGFITGIKIINKTDKKIVEQLKKIIFDD